jgi:dihydrofolate synthase/folylpolyglutamate synthase
MLSDLDCYNESANYLYALQKHGIKLGLENPKKLLTILNEPQKSFLSVHIAGTNGKGSTAAMISSILKESGFKVGLFTSPHLASFTERIRINNVPIPEREVIRLTAHIRKAIAASDIKPTFFEFITAMAFYYFASEKIDWAVVEVGMGGRFDATNVLLPHVSVITNIGFDHREFLGETLSDIAFEKAGIIKNTVPVVTAAQHPEALKTVERIAKNCAAELHTCGKDFKGTLLHMDERHIVFDYITMNPSLVQNKYFRGYKKLFLPLTGKHQMYNASLAIRTCEILRQRGFSVGDDAVKNGLKKLTMEGRIECVSQTPSILIDSAHNPDAAQTLARAVKEVFSEHNKFITIIGVMNDKDIEGILKPLAQISDTFIFTKPKGERAASPEHLKEIMKQMIQNNRDLVTASLLTTKTVEEALTLAKNLQKKDHTILVTGSFYTTGEVKEIMGKPGVLSQLRE